jgi:hypothetical protein
VDVAVNLGGTSFTDLVPPSSQPVTYVYYVHSIGAGGHESARGVPDYATTATSLFADLVEPGAPVLASTIGELRRGVNAVRTAAGYAPLFSGGGPAVGDDITAADLINVLNALNSARSAFALAPFAHSGVPAPAPGELIRAVHIQQLREALK